MPELKYTREKIIREMDYSYICPDCKKNEAKCMICEVNGEYVPTDHSKSKKKKKSNQKKEGMDEELLNDPFLFL